jgi:hypothetical protein
MNQLHRTGLFMHGRQPVNQAFLVGMGGVTGQGVDVRVDGFALAVQFDVPVWPLAVFLDGAPGSAGCLVSDEEDVVV